MPLEDLASRYPLSSRWGTPLILVETVDVGKVPVHVAGIRVEDSDGQAATGSAADLEESPLDRAYFELLERTSILEASVADAWLATDAEGKKLGRGRLPEQAEGDSNRWRYSKSNGVAAGPSWEVACRRAEWELIERDRLLRSWYGQSQPKPTSVPRMPFGAWDDFYSFEAYLFGPPCREDVVVSGVFGFPKLVAAPLLCGFGARPTADGAVEAASRECIQRLGFLWGEEIPEREPEFAPTADFHQEFFLCPMMHGRLRHWLAGGHVTLDAALAEVTRQEKRERQFIDLTPAGFGENFFVAKAVPLDELPLVFGDPHPSLGRMPASLRIHPIS